VNNGDIPITQVFSTGLLPGDGGRISGLTKREYLAGLALNTILSSYNPYESGDFDSSDWDTTVNNAVGLADALLAALEHKDA